MVLSAVAPGEFECHMALSRALEGWENPMKVAECGPNLLLSSTIYRETEFRKLGFKAPTTRLDAAEEFVYNGTAKSVHVAEGLEV